MKLAVSHIGWEEADEPAALQLLQRLGFAGLEIAPPRIAGPAPYECPEKAAAYAARVREAYGLALCSLQSMWFGQTGSLFGPERAHFLAYTRKAVDFAAAGGIQNLVFGNPKNRVMPQNATKRDAVPFFEESAACAAAHGAVLALEANPAVYGTNFMNTTAEAFEMAEWVASPGCAVNLDFGTMLINGEGVEMLRGKVPRIHHVHISEPQLAPIQPREEHAMLAKLLREEGYTGYVSAEMRAVPLDVLQRVAAYMVEVFA